LLLLFGQQKIIRVTKVSALKFLKNVFLSLWTGK